MLNKHHDLAALRRVLVERARRSPDAYAFFVPEVALIFQTSGQVVRRWIRTGQVAASKVGGSHWRITAREVRRLMGPAS